MLVWEDWIRIFFVDAYDLRSYSLCFVFVTYVELQRREIIGSLEFMQKFY